MKLSVKPAVLKYLVLGAGILGLVLRAWLYAAGTDDSGLLVRGHIAGILLWVLTAVALVGAFCLSRGITGPEKQQDSFPSSSAGGAGAVAAAVGVLAATISEMSAAPNALVTLCTVFGFAAAVVLVFLGVSRLMGQTPHFLLHAALCAYFAVQMVYQYRYWSSDPQLQDYCFQLCACAGLMLTAYHHAAFGADMGSHRSLWFFSLATVYLCGPALAGPGNRLFYLGCGIWAFTNLSSLTAQPRRQRPALNLEDDAPGEEA